MKYSAVPVDSDDGYDSEQMPSPQQPLWLRPVFPWTLAGVFASLTLLFAIRLDQDVNAMSRLGYFQSGYHTDFVTSKSRIQASRHRFYGSPAFHEDGNIYVPNPDPRRYVGDPSIYPEIDTNWNTLTWGRYVLITEEEAKATWGEDIDDYFDHQRGGYVAGFDVFHTLHCLNNIRKALDPEHYPPNGHAHGHGQMLNHSATAAGVRGRSPANDALHQDHCLEQLRQYIMCSGDMTPLPTKFYPGLGRNYVDSDVEHTCRDFDALHDWVVDRYEGPGAVQPII